MTNWSDRFSSKQLDLPKIGDLLPGLRYVVKMWIWILLIVTRPVIKLLRSISNRRKDVPDMDEEIDLDYADEESSSEGSDEASASESDNEIYKELFLLAKEAREAEGKRLVDEGGVRTRRQKLIAGSEGHGSAPPVAPSTSTQDCVICQVNPRSIVLRPCGCLCLCDEGCRESLAVSNYTDCPCCRRIVQGYQKIFTP
jgi:Zinc finger, C3HC4 type (RING finger)